MNSIAPFWDGNETWLVLSGGGLLAAFPLAYAILMPALYMPVIIMLLGLIFRGVAFEFRFKALRSRPIWDYAFHFGSIASAFMQGMIIGAFVKGIRVEGRSFAGHPFDWLSAYSFMTGVGLLFGYALLGAVWLVMKTDGDTQAWARKCASYVLGYVGLFLGIVSISLPLMNADIKALWFSLPNFFYLLPLPLATACLFIADLVRSAQGERIPPLFPEHRCFSYRLPRPRHQPLALPGSVCRHFPGGRRRANLSIVPAHRHRCHPAAGSDLYRLLLLPVPRESFAGRVLLKDRLAGTIHHAEAKGLVALHPSSVPDRGRGRGKNGPTLPPGLPINANLGSSSRFVGVEFIPAMVSGQCFQLGQTGEPCHRYASWKVPRNKGYCVV